MIKIISIAAAALAAVAACVTVATSSDAGVVVNCNPASLLPVFGGTQGAAGTLGDTFKLRNVGTTTCSVDGYPAVHNYRADGRPLRTHVTQIVLKFSPVTLLPGQHASFVLTYPNPTITGCTPEHPARMTIQVTGEPLPVIAPQGVHACHGNINQETALVHGG